MGEEIATPLDPDTARYLDLLHIGVSDYGDIYDAMAYADALGPWRWTESDPTTIPAASTAEQEMTA